MRIVYQENQKLRIINTSKDLSVTSFFFPKGMEGTFYCRVNDELLKLTKVDEDKNYDWYGVSLDNYIGVENGEVSVSIVIFKGDSVIFSDVEKVEMTFDSYKEAQKLSLLEKTVAQIKELTQLNIDIYESIREVTGK
jgi:hypothetical protein